MASPRPVPPYLRVVLDSACSKDLNNLACCSGVMPIPVSVTPICKVQMPSSSLIKRALRVIEPFSGVNLTALLKRLARTWASLWSSPINVLGIFLSICTDNFCFFSSTRKLITFTTCWSIFSKLNSIMESSNLSASIFDISKISLITPSRWLEASSILVRQ